MSPVPGGRFSIGLPGKRRRDVSWIAQPYPQTLRGEALLVPLEQKSVVQQSADGRPGANLEPAVAGVRGDDQLRLGGRDDLRRLGGRCGLGSADDNGAVSTVSTGEVEGAGTVAPASSELAFAFEAPSAELSCQMPMAMSVPASRIANERTGSRRER